MMALGSLAFRIASRRRLPPHARDDRGDHRLPAGVAVGHPRRALLRPGAPAPRALPRAQRGQPRREHDDGQPQRRVLPGGRVRQRRWPPSRSCSSAAARSSTATSRSACSSASSPRSTASSTRSASSRSSTRPTSRAWPRWTRSSSCSTRSPTSSTRPTRSSSPTIRGEIRFDDVTFAYRTADGTKNALTNVDLTVPPGQTVALVGATGAGKSTFAKLVARFYDPTERPRARRRPRPARRAGQLAARADGDRAAGGLPVQRDGGRQHRLRPARRDADGGRGGRRGRRGRGVHRGAAPTATTPRSASAASSSRPASASCWPSPAR